jgi:hypothetical protein
VVGAAFFGFRLILRVSLRRAISADGSRDS